METDASVVSSGWTGGAGYSVVAGTAITPTYGNNMQSYFMVIAVPGTRAMFTLTSFNADPSDCVTVTSGSQAFGGAYVGSACGGDVTPLTFISLNTSNILVVEWLTDLSLSGTASGYSATGWTALTGEYQRYNIVAGSPFTPPYLNNLDLGWTITATAGSSATFTAGSVVAQNSDFIRGMLNVECAVLVLVLVLCYVVLIIIIICCVLLFLLLLWWWW